MARTQSTQGGRGGRGGYRGGNQGRKSTPATPTKKQFHPLLSDIKARFSYEEVEDSLIEYIRLSAQRNIEDLVLSIRSKKLIDLDALKPKIGVSTDADPDVKAAENEAHRIDYTAAQKAHTMRVSDLGVNSP